VVLIYRTRLWQLARSVLRRDGEAVYGQPARDYFWKLVAAFGVTAALGLVVKQLGFELPETITPVAWALVLGGVWMLLAERGAARRAQALGERSTITWTVALLVGVAQVLAGVFPGTSRSAATIFIALLAGTTSRVAATEFAFLVGIPTMFAATFYELVSLYRHEGLGGEDWGALAVAFAAATLTAFVAVKWLLRYIQSHRFTAFALYRIVFGMALLLLVPAGG
jgi:undecaprenyl-diphosphatase